MTASTRARRMLEGRRALTERERGQPEPDKDGEGHGMAVIATVQRQRLFTGRIDEWWRRAPYCR